MIKTLKYMPYAQAKVREYPGIGRISRVLQSYATDVIYVDRQGLLECTGLYSMTTRKHISAFIREYYSNISFYDVKKIAGTQKKIDTKTGDIIG